MTTTTIAAMIVIHSFIHNRCQGTYQKKTPIRSTKNELFVCVCVCVQNNDIATYINYVLLLVSPLCFSKKKKNLPLHIPHTNTQPPPSQKNSTAQYFYVKMNEKFSF